MITTLYYFIYSHRESRTLKQIPGEMHNYDKEHFSEQPDFDSANYSFSESDYGDNNQKGSYMVNSWWNENKM